MAGGRPRVELDKKSFENLCGMMCTLEEIAGFFNCSEDTVQRWCKREYGESFAVIYKKYSAKGKISLRRNQLKLSEKSAAMAIFLGKQYLGQSDIVTENSEENSGITIKIAKGEREESNETETETESRKRKDGK